MGCKRKLRFTMVELMVVIAIIGLCGGMMGYYFMSKKQEDSIASSDVNFIEAKKAMTFIRKTFLRSKGVVKYSKDGSITYWNEGNEQRTLFLEDGILKDTSFEGMNAEKIAAQVKTFKVMPVGVLGRQTIKFAVECGSDSDSIPLTTTICIRNDLGVARGK